jgi:hypothetical protein
MGVTSNRALARQLGVSETAVRRAEKAGRIAREADGSWDPATVKAKWASNTDPAQQRQSPAAGPRGGRSAVRRGAMKPVPEAALGAVRDTLREKRRVGLGRRDDLHTSADSRTKCSKPRSAGSACSA